MEKISIQESKPPRQRVVTGDRPPSYVSKATLAKELDISESTVDAWVQRGILPEPIRCGTSVRWCWAQVVAAMSIMGQVDADPFMVGVRNVT